MDLGYYENSVKLLLESFQCFFRGLITFILSSLLGPRREIFSEKNSREKNITFHRTCSIHCEVWIAVFRCELNNIYFTLLS